MAKYRIRTGGFLLLVAFCHLASAVSGQTADPPKASWQVGYKGTGYAFQSQDRSGTTIDRFQQFHALSGSVTGIAGGWLTFRGSGRFANDQLTDRVGYEQAKWYTGLAEARIGRAWKARVGRQLVQAGVTSLTLDGAEVAFQPDRSWNLAAWGGAKAPVYHTFDFGDFDQNVALGGRIAYRPNPSWRLGISTAYRESQGKVAARPVGAEVMTGAVTNAIPAWGQVSRMARRAGVAQTMSPIWLCWRTISIRPGRSANRSVGVKRGRRASLARAAEACLLIIRAGLADIRTQSPQWHIDCDDRKQIRSALVKAQPGQ